MSAFLILSLFLLVPHIVLASSGSSGDLLFLWNAAGWTLSIFVIILLWFVFVIVAVNLRSGSKKKKKRAVEYITHTVKRGDSLTRIAGKFDTTKDILIDLNNLKSPYKLKLGQRLRVPLEDDIDGTRGRVDDVHRRVSDKELSWLKGSGDESVFQLPANTKMFLGRHMVILLIFSGVIGILMIVNLAWIQYDISRYTGEVLVNFSTLKTSRGETANYPSDSISQNGEDISKISVGEEDVIVPVRVLNGVGISGAASKLASLMEKEGFEIVDVGNADRFNYNSTVVRYDPKQKLWAQVVEGWLVVQGYSVELEEIKNDNTRDEIVVVIGK